MPADHLGHTVNFWIRFDLGVRAVLGSPALIVSVSAANAFNSSLEKNGLKKNGKKGSLPSAMCMY